MDRQKSNRVVSVIASLMVVTSLVLSVSPAMAAQPASQGRGGKFEAHLLGANEVAPGDPDGKGHAAMRIVPGQGSVCFEIEVEDVAPIVAAHIHSGMAGVNGPIVVDFMVAQNGLSGCVVVDPAVTKAIVRNPSAYYVNVHNADFPAGALRGQLTR